MCFFNRTIKPTILYAPQTAITLNKAGQTLINFIRKKEKKRSTTAYTKKHLT